MLDIGTVIRLKLNIRGPKKEKLNQRIFLSGHKKIEVNYQEQNGTNQDLR